MIALGLCALRTEPPGVMFYHAFHMLPWYGIFIFCSGILLYELLRYKKNFTIALVTIVFTLSLFIISSRAFIWEKVNKEKEFNKNYGREFVYGETIRLLANKNDTLFVNMRDSLIYWQANLPSSYKYVFYYPVMEPIALYADEKKNSLKKNPPTFYYTPCNKNEYASATSPAYLGGEYIKLQQLETTTCLYMKREKVANISAQQKEAIRKLGVSL